MSDPKLPSPTRPELWFWFVLTISVVVARLVSRRLLAHAWRLWIDDWLMLVTTIFFICTIGLIQASISWDYQGLFIDYETVKPERLEYLSKVFAVLMMLLDHVGLATVWLCKACMLVMLYRMTFNLKQNVAIQVIAGITAFSYLFIMVAFLGIWCRPLTEYVALNPANPQCQTAANHMISVAVCNIATDLMILFVTVPLFVNTRLPLRKKMTVVFLFSLGIITIAVTAVHRIGAIYSTSMDFWVWTARETALSVIVVNMPLTVPFWNRAKTITTGITSNSTFSRFRSQPTGQASGADFSKLESSGATSASVSKNATRTDVSTTKDTYVDLEGGGTWYNAKDESSDYSHRAEVPRSPLQGNKF